MLGSRNRTGEVFALLLVLASLMRCSGTPPADVNAAGEGGGGNQAARGPSLGGEGGTSAAAGEGGGTLAGGMPGASGSGAASGASSTGGDSGGPWEGAAGEGQAEDGGSAGGPQSGLSGGAAGSDGSSDCELRYTEGHGDVFIGYDAGLSLSIRSAFGATSEQLVDPARVCVSVPAASHALTASSGGAPDGEEFAFLGVAPGEPFWMLPASPRAGMPWLGATTEAIPSGRYTGDRVVLSITAVEVPLGGDVSVFTADPLGVPSVIYSTVTGALAHTFPTGAHLHFYWAFTVAGAYTLTFQAEGAHRDGVDVSPAAALRFVVTAP